MKAIVRTSLEPESFELCERPVPEINENEVLIRIRSVGVCGTDLHIYHGHVETATDLIIGHELSGVIEKAGANVTSVKPGDRVVSRLNVGVCGTCKACLSGNPQMCEHRTCPGHWVDGAFAEYMKIEASQVIPFSEQVSFDEAAFVEPMACTAHALLERTKVLPEEVVVVYGPGPIGLLAMQMAKAHGASKVIMVGTARSAKLRLPLAKKLGADLCLIDGKDDVEGIVRKLTDGEGADLCVDCSGAEAAINSCIRMLRRQGRLCVIGLPGRPELSVQWLLAAQKSLDLIFSYSSSPTSWNLCLSMLERKAVDVKSLISHCGSLEDYKQIFEEADKGRVIKAMLHP